MKNKLQISLQDIEAAEWFCKAIKKCPQENIEHCIFISLSKDHRCLNCEVALFKQEVAVRAQPFLEAWKRLMALTTFSVEDRRLALFHVFIGLGALYSLNNKMVPVITDAAIQEVSKKAREDQVGFLNEVISDLRGLGYDWYNNFYTAWSDLQMIDRIWLNHILLLKIFLEAIKLQPRPDPKKSKNPIPDWASEEEKKQLTDEVLGFIREEVKKKKK